MTYLTDNCRFGFMWCNDVEHSAHEIGFKLLVSIINAGFNSAFMKSGPPFTMYRFPSLPSASSLNASSSASKPPNE
jgi:hypothetical protein